MANRSLKNSKEPLSNWKKAGFEVRLNEKWVEINMSSQVLFGSGYAKLSEKAGPVLDQLVDVISDFKNPLRVEGLYR